MQNDKVKVKLQKNHIIIKLLVDKQHFVFYKVNVFIIYENVILQYDILSMYKFMLQQAGKLKCIIMRHVQHISSLKYSSETHLTKEQC